MRPYSDEEITRNQSQYRAYVRKIDLFTGLAILFLMFSVIGLVATRPPGAPDWQYHVLIAVTAVFTVSAFTAMYWVFRVIQMGSAFEPEYQEERFQLLALARAAHPDVQSFMGVVEKRKKGLVRSESDYLVRLIKDCADTEKHAD